MWVMGFGVNGANLRKSLLKRFPANKSLFCAFLFRGLCLSPESTKGSMYSVELLFFPFQFRRFSRIVNVLLFYEA